jgi:hypothetical protein
MKNNITYDQKWDMAAGGNEYAPAWLVYERGSDDCDGHAIIQCYFLEANGWDAYMIGLSIEGGGPGHNVCGVNLPDGRILVLKRALCIILCLFLASCAAPLSQITQPQITQPTPAMVISN